MKTTLAISVMAMLCLSFPAVQSNSAMPAAPSSSPAVDVSVSSPAMLVGIGRIKSKNGNNYVVNSNDGNAYFAVSETAYAVGDYVYHSDPVLGWVEILGHAD